MEIIFFFDNGGGATLYRETEENTGEGFYFNGSSSDVKTLAACVNAPEEIDWTSALQVFSAEEIKKIKSSCVGWEEYMFIEEFKRAELPPFSGNFCKEVWFEVQKQIYFKADSCKEKQETAEKIFDALDSQEFLVTDDEGLNMCEASLKPFSAAGVEYYAYQDSQAGYEILKKSDYEWLNLEEKE